MPTLAALRTEPTPMTSVQKMTGWIIILISATKVVPIHLSPTAKSGRTRPVIDAEDHRDDHRDVEVVGAVLRDRRPCRWWCSWFLRLVLLGVGGPVPCATSCGLV